ncbi:MAG: hypothetical protein VKS61_03510 [Candidatus Sericytochromatia bacterium]|nr:hypothetical protein [Candidatus Sericytochromatia bacterium]
MGESWAPGREAAALGGTAALVLAFVALMTAFEPGFFWHDDAQAWWVPLMVDVQRAWAAGEWPLVTPWSWHATSLAGEYQPGIFSPLVLGGYALATTLAATMPGMAAVYAGAMLLVAASGAHVLARVEGVPRPLAVMVGLVAALNGWSISWAASNWFPVAAGFGALLWVWAALAWGLQGGPRRRAVAAVAVAVAVLVTAGGPHMVLMALAITAALAGRAAWRARAAWPVGLAAVAWVLGLGLAAPAWATFLGGLPHTLRAGHGLALTWQRLLPLEALPGMVSPAWVVRGFVLEGSGPQLPIELANGLVVPAVWLAAILAGGRQGWRALGWHAGLAGVCLLLAALPSLGTFRWSYRWLLPAHVALALGAAQWLAWRWRSGPGRLRDHPALWGALALGGVHLGTLQQPVVPAAYHAGLLTLLLAWALLERAARAGRAWGRWGPPLITLAALVTTYRFIPHHLLVPTWPLPDVLRPHPVLEPGRRYLLAGDLPTYYPGRSPDEGFGRVRLVGALPLAAGVPFVNGYSALAPRGSFRAFAFDMTGYQPADVVARVWRVDAAPGALLARLGVDGLVLATPSEAARGQLQAHGWRLVAVDAGGQIWHRGAAPSPLVAAGEGLRRVAPGDEAAWRAALAARDGLAAVEGPDPGEVRVAPRAVRLLRVGRNSLEVEVAPGPAPALLRVARGWAPHWEARLDERPLEVLALDGVVPGVVIPAGVGGRLALRCWPAGLGLGLQVAAATVVLAGVGGLAWGRRRRRGEHFARGVR